MIFKENSSSTPKTPLHMLYLELKSKGLIERLEVSSCSAAFSEALCACSLLGTIHLFP